MASLNEPVTSPAAGEGTCTMNSSEARYPAFLETVADMHEGSSKMLCSPRATVIHGMGSAIRYTDVPCA